MRKNQLIAIVFLLFTTAGMAQRQDTAQHMTFAREDYNKYMKRRNTFNTLGWVMLGAGVVMSGTSYLIYSSNGFNGTWDLEPLFIAGLVTTGASIPVFIAASINKRKARLLLKGENVLFRPPSLRLGYPAIALQIKL